MLNDKELAFINEFREKVKKKLAVMAPEIGPNFPSSNSTTGEWDPLGKTSKIHSWTTAFWPGMMWLMYIATGDETYKKIGEGCEDKLDKAFEVFDGIHHDVGFMWLLSAVADYKLTGNQRSRSRALHAATILAGRFNFVAKYIRAWDHSSMGWAIIDCMMNIQLLFWASLETGDPRFKNIALAHADTTMNHFVRPDGSVNHIVAFDPETGEVLETPRGQGYASGSSWSRGQAWAIYGFAMSYLNSGKAEYLDIAKRVAHYFISNMDETWVPLVDFRAPAEPVYRDTSAGAIAACGLIEIARAVGELERPMYINAAMKLMHALDKNCNYDPKELSLLQNGSSAYHMPNGMHMPWIFGDYYMLEAIMKLSGNDGSFSIHARPEPTV